jgi:hypothetical protein
MSQHAMRQAARRSALDAQAVLRKERAEREHRLEKLAVAVLTALGERDAAVRDAECSAGAALQTMIDDEGLSVREAVELCGSSVTVREVTRLRQLPRHAARQRTMSARRIHHLGIRWAIRAATASALRSRRSASSSNAWLWGTRFSATGAGS